MKLILIGAGGAAHHGYTPILQLLRNKVKEVILYDGDIFEEANISRQALAVGGLGINKAEVMSTWLTQITGVKVDARPSYFFNGSHGKLSRRDLIICMADNHRARREARDFARESGCWLLSCACENRSGEAWLYHPDYENNKELNPFKIWPELETEDGDDPIKRTGCASEAAFDANPQTPYGNAMSAAMSVYLLNNTVLSHEPFKETNPIIASFTGTTLHTIRRCDTADADAAELSCD